MAQLNLCHLLRKRRNLQKEERLLVTLSAVLSEITSADTYSNTGFIPSALFQAVVDSDEFTAAYPLESKNYVGKKVTARGIVFRLTEVMSGASFVTLKLESITKS